jgi:hypothetical protein
MTLLNKSSSLIEVAVVVSEALERAGIVAPLSGGAAMSMYTENRYQTRDLDFVTSERGRALTAVLVPLGFRASSDGRHFVHDPSGWLVEFPPGPLAFGDTVLSSSDVPLLDTAYGQVRVITPTQSLMDRLAAYFHWNEQRTLRDQVRQLVATLDAAGQIDWDELYRWADSEKIARQSIDEACDRN